MARYNLIMRDQTYITCIQEAGRQGKTMGKFLNEILDKAAADFTDKPETLLNCLICGKPASKTVIGKGGTVFVCELHKDNVKGNIGIGELKS